MPTPAYISRSLFVFTAAVIAVGAALGHLVTGIGVAAFLFLLGVIEGKPSWRRVYDPDRKREAGVLRFVSWKRVTPGRPNDPDDRFRA